MASLVPSPPHVVFEAAAYAVGFGLYRIRRRRLGDALADHERSSVIVAAILGAFLGSKLLFLLQDPALTLANGHRLTFLMGGKTIVGGLLGGTLAVEGTKARLRIVRRSGDLFTLPLIVGIAIGRVGCLVAGLADHTYGSPTTLPWGIDLGDGVARHPVQLYEIGFLALTALALRLARAHLREGGEYRAFLALYCAWRLAIDFLKPGVAFAGLTVLQWACAAALVVLARRALGGRLRPEVVHG